ncbi:hypothetical protein Nepgr_011934 [Nepenthes gracilis]|uniref:DUF4005 domain-containing protein n=1 Tax=Nepenthes gracilis TaxID=150966 RepID=A0AAD3XMD2_NEPGR|nr:hypothetical protein Nepgr_011934 [Nepenthes gracilis]
MRRKGNWFNALKKALSCGSKKKKDRKKKWFGKKKQSSDPSSSTVETVMPLPVPITPTESELTKHAHSVAIATAKAAEVAVAAAQAAAEVARLTTATHLAGKSDKEMAAITIQTAVRGYLARRYLRALRGLVRLKTITEGEAVKHQTASTLKYMQTLARVHSQICARRVRMSEENEARQRQLLQKQAKEIEKSQAAADWNASLKSKEQIEAHLQSRQEAAIRRERTLAYAFCHQQTWRKSLSSANAMFLDPNNPRWGWSWLERWLAARPWEMAHMPEKELNNNVMTSKDTFFRNGTTNAQAQHQPEKPSPTAGRRQTHSASRLSISIPPSKAASPKSVVRKLKSENTKASQPSSPGGSVWDLYDDSRSVMSIHSDQCRRHSVAGSSIRDDVSLASSQAVPSYMAPTVSARAKSRLRSPSNMNKISTPDRLSVSSAKKRISYPTSPAQSRHSASSVTDRNRFSEPIFTE